MSEGALICPHCSMLFVRDSDGFVRAVETETVRPNLEPYRFTPMQHRIVRQILIGMSTKEIAESTRTSVRYVRKVLSEQIYMKVGCRSDRESLILALLKQQVDFSVPERGSGLFVSRPRKKKTE